MTLRGLFLVVAVVLFAFAGVNYSDHFVDGISDLEVVAFGLFFFALADLVVEFNANRSLRR
jgi:hypothetical protein